MKRENMKQRIKISAILIILLIVSTAIATSASQKGNNPTLPDPSGRDKVQHIVEDLVANATKNATANPTITLVNPPKIEVIGNLYVSTNDIED